MEETNQPISPSYQPVMPGMPGAPLGDQAAHERRDHAKIIALSLGIVILSGLIIFIVVVKQRPKTISPITPVLKPTPTGVTQRPRTLSPLASNSAFLALEQSVRELEATIGAAVVQDQEIIGWPVLDLPLGFSN